MEIERKFLLDNLPINIDKFKSSELLQTYLSFEPELRVRKIDGRYILTKKIGNGMIRNEKEFEINSNLYNFLINGLEDKTISKTRYYIPLSSKTTACIDVYHNNLDGLKVVEVEFETSEEALNFEVPNWFGTEITGNEEYKNSNLINKNNNTKKKN